MAKESRAHALFFPLPLQGHITPQLLLAKLLAASHFKITLVTTQALHASMQHAARNNQEEDEGEDCITVLSIPDGLSPEDRVGPHSHLKLIEAVEKLGPALEELVEKLQKTPWPLTCIVSDVFCSVATSNVALKFRLPRSAFFVSNASVLNIHLHVPSLLAQGILPAQDANNAPPITGIHGLPSLPFRYLPDEMLSPDISTFLFQFLLRQFAIARHSTYVFVNAFEELEADAATAIRKEVPLLPVGPLLLHDILNEERAAPGQGQGPDLWKVDESCLQWLDRQEPSSVIYVSFGSLAVLSNEEMQQLALGLEASKQPFLWAIRPTPDTTLEGLLPEGFLARTEAQGLVISWAPQKSVLQHASVGAFLTHCGWNSAIEGISFGVPMLGWPCFVEQSTTCWLMENFWGIGIELRRAKSGKVGQEEVVNGILEVMRGERGKSARKKVGELKKVAAEAVKEEGSSWKNLKLFIEDMKKRVAP